MLTILKQKTSVHTADPAHLVGDGTAQTRHHWGGTLRG